ncbi:MAG: hypothetical protein ISR95_06395 [Candidatus Marinimicrobia bacterium]|nr:hypothetical protein [Candidatus Neomarinimicrobiota bacterium]MBL7110071.1 hypothetical protein [Candidatus Neomarinimicrobiota bacterium]
MEVLHKELPLERWKKMSFVEQMANIGSEISRATHWRKKNNSQYSLKAVNRALELLSFTIDSITVKSHLKELTRVKEGIIDFFYGDNEYSSSDILWKRYFDSFNYTANRKN